MTDKAENSSVINVLYTERKIICENRGSRGLVLPVALPELAPRGAMGSPIQRPKCRLIPGWLSACLVVRVGAGMELGFCMLLPLSHGPEWAQSTGGSPPASEAALGPIRWLERQMLGWTNELPVSSSLDSLFLPHIPLRVSRLEGQRPRYTQDMKGRDPSQCLEPGSLCSDPGILLPAIRPLRASVSSSVQGT